MNEQIKDGGLKVHSGQCCMCDIGIPVGANDAAGNPLHTGDIVLIYQGRYIDTEIEQWDQEGGLTVVLAEQYQTYGDGSVRVEGDGSFYVMGIKSCGFDHPEWQIKRVKSYADVVDGEHWKDYGFGYRKNAAADAAREKKS